MAHPLVKLSVGPRHVNPGDPVATWLDRLQETDAVRMKGLVEALEQLDPVRERRIVEAARAELGGMIDRLRLEAHLADVGTAGAENKRVRSS